MRLSPRWPLAVALVAAACAHAPHPTNHRRSTMRHDSRANATPTAHADALLDQYAETWRFRLGAPESVRVTPDGREVLFLRSGPRDFVRDLYAFDVATGLERRLLTAAELLGGAEESLTVEERARRQRMRMAARGIASFQLSPDGARILFPLSGRLYVYERATQRARVVAPEGGAPVDPRWSPDGRWISCVRDGELHVIDAATGAQRAVTSGATEGITHGTAEFVAQEEMDRMEGYWWSADSRALAYQETDERGVERFQIADPMHPERAPDGFAYPRAGRTNATVKLGIVAVESGATTWVQWDRAAYPYLAKATWSDGAPLTILVQNRAQTEERLLAVAPDGSSRPLLAEADAAWINIDPSMPRWLPGGAGFLWSTERAGRWQVELRRPDGTLERVVVAPELGYRKLLHVDAAARTVRFLASDEPTEQHVWRAALDGSTAPTRETTLPGEHDAEVGAGDVRVVHRAALTEAASWQVVRGDAVVGSLASLVEEPVLAPRVELVRVGDDELRAAVVRPSNHRAGQRYPVILMVYGGPHAQMVGQSRARYTLAQYFAEQGFVVVSLDGRGTPNRGREWERAIHRSFGDVPIDDQVRGLRALGARFPELDLERVGVYGWSFGGYLAALAMLRRSDVFRAGIAGAPVSDWRDYDTHYTERYMGVPTGDDDATYRQGSLLTWADGLRQPLLVIHGTADDNVYFLHGVRLSDALFRAGRAHEFLPLAGSTHSVADPVVARLLFHRMADFFRRHLHP
ncbi:MAG: Dipeptidyl peptidase [Myxococcaceae bacterium]|nr:Dipeptidyl peptidase [Myxococcaceae bacterium]